MICVFDLDGTLAEVGKAVDENNARRLLKICREGHTIAVCSGKPVYYLCGFMRQLGVPNPILIGENGATIQFGVDLPPKRYDLPISQQSKNNVIRLKTLLDDEFCGDMYYQPNEVCLTPFPKSAEEFERIDKVLKNNPDVLDGIDYYVHFDSVDFVPYGVNKNNGLRFLANILNLDGKDFIAIGDGVNDYPMFNFAHKSIGINLSQPQNAYFNVDSLSQALTCLESILS